MSVKKKKWERGRPDPIIGMNHFGFDPDEMIIKITGRYTMTDDRFIQFVKENSHADIIARIWNDKDAYTGYFALKAKYLDQLIHQFFYEHDHLSSESLIELVFGRFLSSRKEDLRIIPIERREYGFEALRRR